MEPWSINTLFGKMHQVSPLLIYFLFLYILRYDKYITVALKVETDISASIKANQKGRAMILMIMFVRTFKTDVIVFIGNKPHNICFHTDRYFPVSESVRCYWQYHSVSSKEKCPIYRYIFIRISSKFWFSCLWPLLK